MKKNYNQPIVETAEVFATSLMQSASNGVTVNQEPIPNEGGGD